ncbi:hypothetical protein A671_04755 [Salmonella enterica subsp. enterica serovar Dublin str. DG22]|uniref:Uncharacterized protein n=2 Tax=Salmonella dublin TaxID=98360 RepID=M7REW3_SALDU|nr:hypothetical protein SeD_A4901 [Salmonella enterica subsp. enterica serovar Dublin str. CT_02021853]EMR50343.1 hypothetical protein A670_04457 [Salmonella enterica subsp. enterica serovar Dublin str. UC16]EPI64298.1 hypothetical protein A671_04755 [Salmonella enterica subsp. enterica serovar Dublin str. DG22]
MFMYEKYLRDIFQWVKKRFPTLQPCQWPKDTPRLSKRPLSGI